MFSNVQAIEKIQYIETAPNATIDSIKQDIANYT